MQIAVYPSMKGLYIFISLICFIATTAFADYPPELPPLKDRLLLIDGLPNDGQTTCMAYQMNSQLAVTSEQCAKSINNISQQTPIRLLNEAGNSIPLTEKPVKAASGLFYLKLKPSSLAPQASAAKSPHSNPPLTLQSEADVWYPTLSGDGISFQSVKTLLQQEGTQFIAPLQHPISGAPVFREGHLVCITTEKQQCASYAPLKHMESSCTKETIPTCKNDDKCLDYCGNYGCSTNYYEENSGLISIASCKRYTWCNSYEDGGFECVGKTAFCRRLGCDEACYYSLEQSSFKCQEDNFWTDLFYKSGIVGGIAGLSFFIWSRHQKQ